ncbi:MAG: hypothetical protein AAF963_02290 [Bacteroidota bacterium]
MAQEQAFKGSKVGKWLLGKAPAVLDLVGDFFPPARLLKNLVDSATPDLPKEDRLEFEKLLKDYELNVYAKEVEDRQSARQMYAAKHEATDWVAKRIMTWNLLFIVVLVGANITCILYLESTLLAIVSNVIGQVTQALINERLTVVNFFMGSSKGSADKNEMLSRGFSFSHEYPSA